MKNRSTLALIIPLLLTLTAIISSAAPDHPANNNRNTPSPISICVFCSASNTVEAKYTSTAEKLGAALAARKWTLLWGGSENGLMGAVARGAKQNGGRMIGMITKQDYTWGGIAQNADELHTFDTVSERKHALQTRANAFIILPGGLGTLDELADTLEQKALAAPDSPLSRKPIIIFNQDGYYDQLLSFLKSAETKKFINPAANQSYTVATSLDDLLAQLDKNTSLAAAQ